MSSVHENWNVYFTPTGTLVIHKIIGDLERCPSDGNATFLAVAGDMLRNAHRHEDEPRFASTHWGNG
jgi:hypothetical protein